MARDPADELIERLDIIQRLLAYLVAAQHDSLKERAVTLRNLGLTPTAIAQVCGTSAGAVSVRLAESRRKKPTGRRKR